MRHDLAEHEWVTDYSEFDAVLVCRNELDAFDPEVCLRAYQTFKWDDASTPGNDLAFRHEATGALVRHDGSVVAIDTLHDDPIEPLQDLFRVLHGLGWSKADVYHPAETMPLMLKDMGQAIPAQLSQLGFDIQPAASVTKISNFAESQALVSRGQEILKNSRAGISNTSSTMLSELESITSEITESDETQNEVAAVVLPPSSGGVFQNFDLDDDEPKTTGAGGAPDSGVDVRQVFPSDEEVGASEISPPQSENGSDDLAHLVLENERLREELLTAQNARWQLARANAEAQTAAGNFDVERENLRGQINSLKEELSDAVGREELAGEASVRDGLIRENLMNEVVELRNKFEQVKERGIMESDVVKIGASAICFDFPESPIAKGALDLMAVDYSVDEIVHLHVGAVGQVIRWDVLGEISDQFPWEAENLACGLKFPAEHCALVGGILLDLKAKVPQAQLRDLLKGLDGDASVRETLAQGVPPSMGLLFGRMLPSENLDALVLRLSPLALCCNGGAFVDIRSDADGLGIFTVRGLLDSFAAKLFVVHVDAMDGPFVRAVADLLRFVALGYAATARYQAVELHASVPGDDAVDVSPETLQEEPVEDAVDQTQKTLNELRLGLIAFLQRLDAVGKMGG